MRDITKRKCGTNHVKGTCLALPMRLFSIHRQPLPLEPRVPSEYQPYSERLTPCADTSPGKRARHFLASDGCEWRVREVPLPDCEKRAGFCLVFEATGVARRVWSYPADWFDASEATLRALCDATPSRRAAPECEAPRGA